MAYYGGHNVVQKINWLTKCANLLKDCNESVKLSEI